MREISRIMSLKWKWSIILFLLSLILFVAGCRSRVHIPYPPEPWLPEKELSQMGYTIQVGAFSVLNNAVRLTESLNALELNAYYFVHKSGLYKVRFGNYLSKKDALQRAKLLVAKGIIDEYYIVSPEDYAVVKKIKYGEQYLRNELVTTAESFLGIPYLLGGISPDEGFDCSGLTMAVYHLNGLNLPRSSKEQYKVGAPVKQSELKRGDLVFFNTSQGKSVTHVAIYAGDYNFIHAPGKNKRVRTDSLINRYFKNRFVGARTYLQ